MRVIGHSSFKSSCARKSLKKTICHLSSVTSYQRKNSVGYDRCQKSLLNNLAIRKKRVTFAVEVNEKCFNE